jgi:hypothetical protein
MANNEEDPSLTLCITRSGSNQRVVLSFPARNTTVAQLQQQSRASLGISSDNRIEEEDEQWHVNGVPRRLLLRNQWDQSLMEAGIRHQDRISVTIPEAALTKTKKNESSNSSTTPRSKRKAAVAATESFAADTVAMIKAEEEAEVPKRKRAAPSSTRAPSVAQHFRQLAASPGRRLHDGEEVQVTTRRRQKSTLMDGTVNPKTSLEEGLVAATSDRSSAARLMRRGWRQAVQSAYEQNQAAARVAAVQNLSSSKLIFSLLDSNAHGANTQQQQLQVSYPKGIQGRGTFTDVVDYLPLDLVVAAVQSLHPSEALRSSHLALLSPRVFWSLLYHFHQQHLNTNDVESLTQLGWGDVVHAAMQWSCPSCDWSYLRRRPEQLSAKALENQRQKQQNTVDWEAAAAAITDVESAMEHMWENATSNGATPNAASVDEEDDWMIVTPTEEDLDELRECILAVECGTAPLDTDSVENIVQALSQRCAIRNWRELANRDGADLFAQLHDAIQDDHILVSVDAVEAWIEQAQLRSLEEIMVEICNGDMKALEGLRDGVRSGTPADLAIWESIPGTLLQQLKASVPDHECTEPDLQRWCRRARRAMEQLEWLADYASPIED